MIACFIAIFALSGLLGTSLYFNYKLGMLVFRMEDNIAACLEELNKAYARIGRVLNFPVGSDDPFVQDVVESLKMAQRAVLVVANKMVDGWKQLDERNPDGTPGSTRSTEKKNS